MTMTETRHRKAFAELEALRQSHGGILHPPDVVEFATDPDTDLHSRFQWDDTEAAKKYRLSATHAGR